MQNHPLNKVVFIQKVAAFTQTRSPKDLFRLAFVNDSWNDTIKNYAFHLFETRVRVGSAFTLERVFVFSHVVKYDMIWFMDVLLSKSFLERSGKCLLLFCENVPSLAMMNLVFAKIDAAGGKDMLKRQITATDDKHVGWNCLMVLCSSSEVEVLELFFQKIVEVGGNDLLNHQLAFKDRLSRHCLMLGCENSSSLRVVELVLEKLHEIGGKDMLRSHLASTDRDGKTCLMFSLSNSSCPEVAKLVLFEIIKVGGKDMLRNELASKTDHGWNCLMLGCRFCSSPEVVKLLADFLFEFNLFEEQYAELGSNGKDKLREKTGIDSSSWTPDAESLAEVKTILNRKC